LAKRAETRQTVAPFNGATIGGQFDPRDSLQDAGDPAQKGKGEEGFCRDSEAREESREAQREEGPRARREARLIERYAELSRDRDHREAFLAERRSDRRAFSMLERVGCPYGNADRCPIKALPAQAGKPGEIAHFSVKCRSPFGLPTHPGIENKEYPPCRKSSSI
jgi:hypothetical protein